jgi:hypothetical protein
VETLRSSQLLDELLFLPSSPLAPISAHVRHCEDSAEITHSPLPESRMSPISLIIRPLLCPPIHYCTELPPIPLLQAPSKLRTQAKTEFANCHLVPTACLPSVHIPDFVS